MGLFGSDEYTDYTLLKEKGLLKVEEEKEESVKIKEGFVDLTSETINAIEDKNKDKSATNASVPNLDFLGDGSFGSNENGSYGVSTESKKESEDIANIKIKLEELEYKIDRLIDRLNKIEPAN